ncbi:MAG: nucleotidyltransferase domain-containing protein, partial [Candidatus Hydrothermarchaeales archaeon]
MRFHKVFDDILGNKTKVKLLRAFSTYPDKEFSESELQRIAGIPQASVHRNVKSLLENGLLGRKRIGKANLYSLNKGHVLYPVVSRLFDEEKNLVKMLKEVIAEKIVGLPEVKLAVLFGSLLKGRERADSDVDIFIVSEGSKFETEEKLKDLTSIVEMRFGNP